MVLVWYSSPGGMTYLPSLGIRIYGWRHPYPPRDIPYKLFEANRKDFKEAPYTAKWLSDKFGGPVEPMAFTYSEVNKMPHPALRALARNMKIHFSGGPGRSSKRKLARAIRTKLRSY